MFCANLAHAVLIALCRPRGGLDLVQELLGDVRVFDAKGVRHKNGEAEDALDLLEYRGQGAAEDDGAAEARGAFQEEERLDVARADCVVHRAQRVAVAEEVCCILGVHGAEGGRGLDDGASCVAGQGAHDGGLDVGEDRDALVEEKLCCDVVDHPAHKDDVGLDGSNAIDDDTEVVALLRYEVADVEDLLLALIVYREVEQQDAGLHELRLHPLEHDVLPAKRERREVRGLIHRASGDNLHAHVFAYVAFVLCHREYICCCRACKAFHRPRPLCRKPLRRHQLDYHLVQPPAHALADDVVMQYPLGLQRCHVWRLERVQHDADNACGAPLPHNLEAFVQGAWRCCLLLLLLLLLLCA